MRNKLSLITFLLLFCLSFNSKATHLAGGQVTAEYIGNSRYVVTIKVFRDCNGIAQSTTSAPLSYTDCSGPQNIALPFVDSNEVSQLCPSQIMQSQCRGGTLPGMQEYIYRDTLTIDQSCGTLNNIEFSWTDGSRNDNISNITNAGSDNIYVPCVVYISQDTTNSTPYFTSQPIPYFCAGQVVTFGLGVVELDGDSLTFELSQPLSAAGTPIAYNGGFTTTNPFATAAGLTINPQTGQLNFTPSNQGLFAFVILCKEYDRVTGQLISETRRDIQIVVRACTNQAPDPNTGVITNLTGLGVQTGNYTIELCEGNSFVFDATFTDPNSGDLLTVISPNLLPGMILTSTPSLTPVSATVSWTAPAGSAGTFTSFTIVVKDNACPIFGQQFYTYYINVIPATNLGPDKVICAAPSTQNNQQLLTPIGGSVYQWYTFVNPGDSIPLTSTTATFIPDGNNFDSVTVKPTVNTYYVVVSNLSSSCRNRDTVYVSLAPDFILNATPSTLLPAHICLYGTYGLNVATNPPDTYTYSWAPSADLSAGNIANPVFTGNQPGTADIIVSVTNSMGCLKLDTAEVIVSNNVQPVVTALANPMLLCPGDSSQLGVQFGSGASANCGPATTNCTTELPYTAGNGTLNQTYPTPFTGFWGDNRMQVLYTKAELNALGFNGGKISSILFNVVQKGSSQPFQNFTIKMGCTSLTAFPTISFVTPYNFGSGLTTVYNNPAYTTVIGNNLFNFTTDYEWNNIDNLLVEFCFDNNSYTNNDIINQTSTTFNSSVDEYGDGLVGCNIAQATASYMWRPNLIFGTCGSQPDPSLYSFAWTPNTNLSNDSIINPFATVFAPTTYQVIVTDIVGGCADTATVLVDTTLSAPLINPINTYCLNSPADTLTASPPAGLWSGVGITDSINGVFDPSVAGAGAHWVYYTKTGNCGGVDSAQVQVRGLPQILPLGPLCSNDSSGYLLQINDTLFNGGVFTCLDNAGAIVNDSTFVAFGLNAGDYTVLYTLSQCVTDTAIQSIEVHVAQFGTVTATTSSPAVCVGDSAQLGVWFQGFAGACNAAAVNCVSETPYTIGTGTLGANTLPSPFLGFWMDGRSQMLFTAAELNALGMNSGIISSISLNVLTKNSTAPFNGFTIKIGCTSQSSYSAANFITGLTTVYSSNYSSVLGANVLNFTNDYVWDGSSNLVVEFCFDNSAYTQYDYVAQTATPFVSVVDVFQDNSVGCTLAAVNQYSVRPNIIFGTCSATPPLTNYSYAWSPAATLSDTSIINPYAFPTTTTTYTVTVRDTAYGCVGTSSVVVDTTTMPPHIIPPSAFCVSGLSDTLFANIQGGVWSGAGIVDANLGLFDPAVAGAGSHWVYYTKSGNCGGVDSVAIVVNSGAIITQLPHYCNNDIAQHQLTLTTAITGGTYTCAAAPGAITTLGVNSYFTANGLNPGTYVVTYTNNTLSCPTDTMTVTVDASSDPTITTTATSYCSTDAGQYFIGSNQFGGTWYSNPATPGFDPNGPFFTPATAGAGVYMIYHNFPGVCGGTDSVQLTVVAPQTVAIATPPTTFCQTDAVLSLAATPTGGAWTLVPGISGNTFNPATATIGANVLTYTFGPAGCTSSATVTMTVNPTPPAPTVTQNTIVCYGTTSGNLTATGVNGSTFNWYETAGLVNSVSTSNIYNPNITAPDSFYVTQTLGGCQSPAAGYLVGFYPNPVAAFSASPTTGDRPLTVAFTNNSTGNSLTYSWNFGDTTHNETNPVYLYEYTGEFTVVLTVTSIDGCVDTASVKIIVNDVFELVVPNVFTPNGDGNNDFFYFKASSDVDNLNCQIFDRWGKKVHEMTSASDKWSGDNHPAGVYFYTITASSKAGHPATSKDAKGNPIKLDGPKAYSGYVQLIREK